MTSSEILTHVLATFGLMTIVLFPTFGLASLIGVLGLGTFAWWWMRTWVTRNRT